MYRRRNRVQVSSRNARRFHLKRIDRSEMDQFAEQDFWFTNWLHSFECGFSYNIDQAIRPLNAGSPVATPFSRYKWGSPSGFAFEGRCPSTGRIGYRRQRPSSHLLAGQMTSITRFFQRLFPILRGARHLQQNVVCVTMP